MRQPQPDISIRERRNLAMALVMAIAGALLAWSVFSLQPGRAVLFAILAVLAKEFHRRHEKQLNEKRQLCATMKESEVSVCALQPRTKKSVLRWLQKARVHVSKSEAVRRATPGD